MSWVLMELDGVKTNMESIEDIEGWVDVRCPCGWTSERRYPWSDDQKAPIRFHFQFCERARP